MHYGDRVRVIRELLGPTAVSQTALLPLLERVNNDSDKARVLTRAAELFVDRAAVRDPYFAALNSIPSSGDWQRVLLALLSRPTLTPETVEAVTRSAAQLPNDGDRRRVRDVLVIRR